MHFNYSEYTGVDFFLKWWQVISNTFSIVEWMLICAFIVLSIYYLIYGNKKERVMFLSTTIILTVLVLNPWSTLILNKLLGSAFANRVFRYFWLYPLYMQLTYFVTELAFRKKRRIRVIAMWFCLTCALITGCQQLISGHYNTLGGHQEFKTIENIYKISDDVIDVAKIIEADKGDAAKEVRVLYEREIGMEIRTYDSSIVTAHHGVYAASIWDRTTLSSYVEAGDWRGILAAFVSTNSGEGIISTDALRIALANTDTEYIIIKSESYNVALLDELEIECIGKSNSGEYSVFRVGEDIKTSDDELEWRARLYSPTQINKFGDLYFINDCWQHRIIYNDNLTAPISEWSTLTEDIIGGHTISSDGSIYVCDDTDNNALRVFVRTDNGFLEVQNITDVCYRPHYTYYDEMTDLFYVLGVDNGELLVYRNENQTLTQVNHISYDGCISSYTRSFAIIDGYMYIIGNSIYKVDYLNDYSIIEVYELPEKMQGTVGLMKVQDYYYLTIYTDRNYNKEPGFIRTRDLNLIIKNEYEDIYDELGLVGTPYLMTEIDGRYYIAEMDQKNGVVSFSVENNMIVDEQSVYYSGSANENSIIRYYSLYIYDD